MRESSSQQNYYLDENTLFERASSKTVILRVALNLIRHILVYKTTFVRKKTFCEQKFPTNKIFFFLHRSTYIPKCAQ